MIPIYLDPATVRMALVGRGAVAARRLRWLQDGGARPEVWSDAPEHELPANRAGLPAGADLARYQVIWIAGLSRMESDGFAAAARAAGVLVNVEDVVDLCDFHTPAVVRRGALTLTAGTGGASPAVARAARETLEAAFPEEWAQALAEIADARALLRRREAGSDALVADARKRLAECGLI